MKKVYSINVSNSVNNSVDDDDTLLRSPYKHQGQCYVYHSN